MYRSRYKSSDFDNQICEFKEGEESVASRINQGLDGDVHNGWDTELWSSKMRE